MYGEVEEDARDGTLRAGLVAEACTADRRARVGNDDADTRHRRLAERLETVTIFEGRDLRIVLGAVRIEARERRPINVGYLLRVFLFLADLTRIDRAGVGDLSFFRLCVIFGVFWSREFF